MGQIHGAVITVMVLVVLAGCSASDSDDPATGSTEAPTRKDHVWKNQTEAIDQAREVEQVLRDAANRQEPRDQ